jgi:hypothetical protein
VVTDAYERVKAETFDLHNRTYLPAALDRLPEVMAASAERGLHRVTLRRLAELLLVSRTAIPDMGLELHRRDPDRCLPPLWAVDDEGIRQLAGGRG